MTRTYIVITMTVACLLLGGCSMLADIMGIISGPVDDSVATLDAAIDKLEGESANWRAVITEFGEKLPQQAKDVIAQFEEVGQRMIATAGVEARCNTDFLGRRLKEELQRIRNKIQQRYTVPEPQPVLCQIVPISITLTAAGKLQLPGNAREVNFFGYNLGSSKVRFNLVNPAGASTDITSCLNVATFYQMVLDLGTNGCGSFLEQENVQWQHIDLTGFFQEAQAPNRMAIIYLPPPHCRVRLNDVPQQTIELIPAFTRGTDKDFGLAEVSYRVTFQLIKTAERVQYKLTMKAEGVPYETLGFKFETDRTTFEGEQGWALHKAPENYKIHDISASTEQYIARGTTKLSVISMEPGGLLKEVKIGIQNPVVGNDNDHVNVKVILNQFTITTVEDPEKVNCQP